MRVVMIAAAALFAVAPGAYAQSTAPAQTPAPEVQPAQPQPPKITKVDVVDITELPTEAQTRVNDAVSGSSEADLDGLRASIDAHQMASDALKAEGITSELVIAATMSPDGTLTLITKKS
jgi:hypothetical protein